MKECELFNLRGVATIGTILQTRIQAQHGDWAAYNLLGCYGVVNKWVPWEIWER